MWYYNSGNEHLGPVPASELQGLLDRHVVTPHTLVWREGMEDWLPLADAGLPQPAIQPESDECETCAYCGEEMTRSGMVPLGGFWIAQAHREAAIAFVREGGQLPRETVPAVAGDVSLGHLLRRTWQVLKISGLLAFGFSLAVVVAAAFFKVFITSFIVRHSEGAVRSFFGSGFLFTGIVMVAVGMAAGGTLHVFDERNSGRRANFEQATVVAFQQCLRMGFAILVLMLLAIVPLAGPAVWLAFHDTDESSTELLDPETLMLVEMLVLSLICYPVLARSSLTCIELLNRKLGLISACRRSWVISRGYFWRTLSFIVVLVLSYILQKYAVKTLSQSASILARIMISNLSLLYCIASAAFLFSYGKELETLYEKKRQTTGTAH